MKRSLIAALVCATSLLSLTTLLPSAAAGAGGNAGAGSDSTKCERGEAHKELQKLFNEAERLEKELTEECPLFYNEDGPYLCSIERYTTYESLLKTTIKVAKDADNFFLLYHLYYHVRAFLKWHLFHLPSGAFLVTVKDHMHLSIPKLTNCSFQLVSTVDEEEFRKRCSFFEMRAKINDVFNAMAQSLLASLSLIEEAWEGAQEDLKLQIKRIALFASYASLFVDHKANAIMLCLFINLPPKLKGFQPFCMRIPDVSHIHIMHTVQKNPDEVSLKLLANDYAQTYTSFTGLSEDAKEETLEDAALKEKSPEEFDPLGSIGCIIS